MNGLTKQGVGFPAHLAVVWPSGSSAGFEFQSRYVTVFPLANVADTVPGSSRFVSSTTTFIGNWRRALDVGVPDQSQFEHIVRLVFRWGESECANLQHS
jgi:hypothetical protein